MMMLPVVFGVQSSAAMRLNLIDVCVFSISEIVMPCGAWVSESFSILGKSHLAGVTSTVVCEPGRTL